jgi:hypothetical protein
MEKIQKVEIDPRNNNDLANWFILRAISNLPDGGRKFPFDSLKHTEKGLEIDIVFKVNGVDLPFLEVIKSITDTFNSTVESRAIEMIHEKFADTIDEIQESLNSISRNINNNVINEIKNKFPKAFQGNDD